MRNKVNSPINIIIFIGFVVSSTPISCNKEDVGINKAKKKIIAVQPKIQNIGACRYRPNISQRTNYLGEAAIGMIEGLDRENYVRYPHIGINGWPNLNKEWGMKGCRDKDIKTWFNCFDPMVEGYPLDRKRQYMPFKDRYNEKHAKATWGVIDSIIKSRALPNYKNIAIIVTHDIMIRNFLDLGRVGKLANSGIMRLDKEKLEVIYAGFKDSKKHSYLTEGYTKTHDTKTRKHIQKIFKNVDIIYVVRHPDALHNKYHNTGKTGKAETNFLNITLKTVRMYDTPLTPLGILQANIALEVLKKDIMQQCNKVDGINLITITSPLNRALHTILMLLDSISPKTKVLSFFNYMAFKRYFNFLNEPKNLKILKKASLHKWVYAYMLRRNAARGYVEVLYKDFAKQPKFLDLAPFLTEDSIGAMLKDYETYDAIYNKKKLECKFSEANLPDYSFIPFRTLEKAPAPQDMPASCCELAYLI